MLNKLLLNRVALENRNTMNRGRQNRREKKKITREPRKAPVYDGKYGRPVGNTKNAVPTVNTVPQEIRQLYAPTPFTTLHPSRPTWRLVVAWNPMMSPLRDEDGKVVKDEDTGKVIKIEVKKS